MTLEQSADASHENFGNQSCLRKNEEFCRSESQTSSHTSGSSEICRICHCEGDSDCSLIAPCYCAGSLRYVHQGCLQQWIKSSNIRCCELCKFQFIMHTKTKPFLEWEPLEMTGFERRKLLCAVLFHAIALTCVVWSLYVLIHRTAEEIHFGLLEWPFWTKLIVVAIGFTGGVVFMYIQCKAYMHICQRWKAFNRVIYIQNAPEKPHSTSPEKASEGGVNVRQKSYSDEASIDLKGVRNVHIFFNDESHVCVQNDHCGPEEGDGALESVSVTPNGTQRCDESSTSWHIKIGKSSGNDLSHPLHQRYEEGKMQEWVDSSQNEATTSDVQCAKNDSVLKLQIKKAEIVIKFKQSSNDEASEKEVEKERKDNTLVNIKIDDKESDPIVIDVVQKNQMEHHPPKDPVQISFGFTQNPEDAIEKDENGYSSLLPPPSSDNSNSNSDVDCGSSSPLLLKKNQSNGSD